MRFKIGQRYILQKKINELIPIVFLLPSISGVAVFVLVPFISVIRTSFSDATDTIYIGFNNYFDVIENLAFSLAVSNTIRFTAICIPMIILISFAFALCVKQLGNLGNALKTIYLIPMALPISSIVLLWRLVFHKNGILNALLSTHIIRPIDFINSGYSFYILIFSYIWKNVGYNMILWIAGLNEINGSLYEAAKVDGASKFQCMVYVTLPSLSSTFYLISILSLINSFKVFREAYLISGGYPDESIYLLQHLFNNWFMHLEIQRLSAAAVMMAFSIVIIIFLLTLLIKE